MEVPLYITACYHVYIPVSANSAFGLLQSVSSGSSAVHNSMLSCIHTCKCELSLWFTTECI